MGALICGIVPFFGGIPAVILGHVARGQIKRTGERGDGVAIAGWCSATCGLPCGC